LSGFGSITDECFIRPDGTILDVEENHTVTAWEEIERLGIDTEGEEDLLYYLDMGAIRIGQGGGGQAYVEVVDMNDKKLNRIIDLFMNKNLSLDTKIVIEDVDYTKGKGQSFRDLALNYKHNAEMTFGDLLEIKHTNELWNKHSQVKIHTLNGVKSREAGPAVIYPDGTQEWWLDGEEIDPEEVLNNSNPEKLPKELEEKYPSLKGALKYFPSFIESIEKYLGEKVKRVASRVLQRYLKELVIDQ
jgi:hypothetical protein